MCAKGKETEKVKVGMITIGQSPRIDITSDIKDILGSRIEIVECGALDNLSHEEIKELQPSVGEYILVTRLRDGTAVKVSREKIIDKMNLCIKKLESMVKVIVLLCTGEFPGLKSKKLLVEPSDLVSHVVKSLLPSGTLGVLIPSSDQINEIMPKWKYNGINVVIEALSPYEEVNEEKVKEKAEKLKSAGVNLIVLDCMGYSTHIAKIVKDATKIPVILSRTLVARVVREIL